jgi:DNA-binding transcriptional LysR family regulator
MRSEHRSISLMELRQLRSFAAVAHDGGYAAAAASLSVTQPAVWRQVRELEVELGLSLFERYGRNVRPTADGNRLLEQAAAVLATVDRFTATAADLRSVRAGVVGIACASPHLQRFLAARIGAFRRVHPGVSLVIREYSGATSPGRGILEDLLDGVVDVATLIGTRNVKEVEGFPVYEVRLVVAVPENHEWRSLESIEVEQLRDRPLIVSQRGAYSRGAIEAACQRAGFEPNVAFTVASPASQVALGRAHLGLPLVVDDAVGPERGGPWPTLVERGKPIGETVSLVWRAGAKLPPSVRAFIEFARDPLADTRPRARRGAARPASRRSAATPPRVAGRERRPVRRSTT